VQPRPGPADQRTEHAGAFLTQGNHRPVPGRTRTWIPGPGPGTNRPLAGNPRRAGGRGFPRRSAGPSRVTFCDTAAPTARRAGILPMSRAACSARSSWPASRPESAR
jgi:hypothetical protein